MLEYVFVAVVLFDFYCGVRDLTCKNKEGTRIEIQLHYSRYKIDTASVHKVFGFLARINQSF